MFALVLCIAGRCIAAKTFPTLKAADDHADMLRDGWEQSGFDGPYSDSDVSLNIVPLSSDLDMSATVYMHNSFIGSSRNDTNKVVVRTTP